MTRKKKMTGKSIQNFMQSCSWVDYNNNTNTNSQEWLTIYSRGRGIIWIIGRRIPPPPGILFLIHEQGGRLKMESVRKIWIFFEEVPKNLISLHTFVIFPRGRRPPNFTRRGTSPFRSVPIPHPPLPTVTYNFLTPQGIHNYLILTYLNLAP